MAQESWKRDTEETGCQPPEGPVRCTNNCGFFGSAATNHLCSKCYRDLVLKQSKVSSAKAVAEKVLLATTQSVFLLERTDQIERTAAETLATASTLSREPISEATSSAAADQREEQRYAPNRCFSCKKRVGLTGFKCRCGNMFCSLHRYSDRHSCSFDYKTAGRDAIAKANPVVKADKIDKI